MMNDYGMRNENKRLRTIREMVRRIERQKRDCMIDELYFSVGKGTERVACNGLLRLNSPRKLHCIIATHRISKDHCRGTCRMCLNKHVKV
jgi:hypothetical protein